VERSWSRDGQEFIRNSNCPDGRKSIVLNLFLISGDESRCHANSNSTPETRRAFATGRLLSFTLACGGLNQTRLCEQKRTSR
jgi:hypothetical protein